MDVHTDAVLDALRGRGHRMTEQRRAIVDEIMRTSGHIEPQDVARRARARVPRVNDSTVYRTLELLEEMGFISHSHIDSGAHYHHAARRDHAHLVCSSCGRSDAVPLDELRDAAAALERRSAFTADFSHYAIGGLCRDCSERGAAHHSRAAHGAPHTGRGSGRKP
ncbi:MAG TPA: transcriptional repressor [Actinomycetota bacterium]|nr:transcriptional repressor [Actinomycetota bacterium]